MIDDIDIKILKSIESKVISGQKLASDLSITRTAVWKRINKLRKLGYKILSTPKGYTLVDSTQFLIKEEIKSTLKTSFIGKDYIHFIEIDSTNRYAKENTFHEGTVIVAEKQTAGKGRKNRKWVSTGKGIYFSIILEPKLPITELMRFSLIFPLSVRKTVEKFTKLNPKIKWPNDIYLNNKKLSGILIESEIEAEKISRLIVGIGLNVNDTKEDLKDIKDIATSMYIETGKIFSRKEVFSHLLNVIEDNYIKYLSDIPFRRKILNYIDNYLLWKGENIVITDDNQKLEGTLIGINDTGGILVKTNSSVISIYSGDVSLRKKDVL